MTIVTLIEKLYKNCYELSLSELRKHLETLVCLGTSVKDYNGMILACKEIDWDVIHLIHEIECLDTRSM